MGKMYPQHSLGCELHLLFHVGVFGTGQAVLREALCGPTRGRPSLPSVVSLGGRSFREGC